MGDLHTIATLHTRTTPPTCNHSGAQSSHTIKYADIICYRQLSTCAQWAGSNRQWAIHRYSIATHCSHSHTYNTPTCTHSGAQSAPTMNSTDVICYRQLSTCTQWAGSNRQWAPYVYTIATHCSYSRTYSTTCTHSGAQSEHTMD